MVILRLRLKLVIRLILFEGTGCATGLAPARSSFTGWWLGFFAFVQRRYLRDRGVPALHRRGPDPRYPGDRLVCFLRETGWKGFEPLRAILEIAMLPLHHRP